MFHVLIKSVLTLVHVVCAHVLHAPAEGNRRRSARQEKGSSNFSLSTVGALCCGMEEDDTRKHSTGSLKPGPLLICLRRCFSVYLEVHAKAAPPPLASISLKGLLVLLYPLNL